MVKYDLTKLGKDQLYTLLNASVVDPKYVLTDKDVALKSISHIGNAAEGTPNSIMSLVPVEGSTVVDPASGTVKRDYTRFELPAVLASIEAPLVIEDEIANFDTAEKIALKFTETVGIAFTPDELKITFEKVDNSVVSTIIVLGNHVGFVGQTPFTINQINPPGEHLNKILMSPNLQGFEL